MDDLFSILLDIPALRQALALIFFGLFGVWFFSRFSGKGKIIFGGLCLLLGVSFYFLPLLQLAAFIPLLALFIFSRRNPVPDRPGYQPAEALVEGGGLKRGLTTPEAAVIMERPLNQVLGVVVLALLRKGVLGIRDQTPLALELLPAFQKSEIADPQERARSRRELAQKDGKVLHPYEDPFIEQIDVSQGAPLGETNFTVAVRALLRHTARRVRGHNLTETRTYYQKHLGRARHDVELQKNERVHDHYFEWLVLDTDFAELYQDYTPAWWEDTGEELDIGGLVSWVDGMVQELGTAVPPGGLQVKTSQGEVLAIGGRDPISPEFFDLVLRELYGGSEG